MSKKIEAAAIHGATLTIRQSLVVLRRLEEDRSSSKVMPIGTTKGVAKEALGKIDGALKTIDRVSFAI